MDILGVITTVLFCVWVVAMIVWVRRIEKEMHRVNERVQKIISQDQESVLSWGDDDED